MNVEPPPRPMSYRPPAGPSDHDSSIGYALIALSQAGLSIPLAFQPQSSIDYMLGTVLPANVEQQETLLGIFASTLIAGASTAWALKGSADRLELDSPTTETLELGLIAMAGTALGIHLYHNKDLTTSGFGVGTAASALTLAVPTVRLMSTSHGRRRLSTRISNFFDTARRIFTFRNGFKLSTTLYAALTPLFFAGGIAYMFAPGWCLTNILGYTLKGRDATFITRNIGGALLSILPAMTLTLRDKAEDDELQQPLPRVLNLGLLVASAGHLGVLAPLLNEPVGRGKYLPAVVGVWVAGAVAAVAGLSSSVVSEIKS